jgi:hypothetical protein
VQVGVALQPLNDITYEQNYVTSVDGVTCKFVKYTLAPASTDNKKGWIIHGEGIYKVNKKHGSETAKLTFPMKNKIRINNRGSISELTTVEYPSST